MLLNLLIIISILLELVLSARQFYFVNALNQRVGDISYKRAKAFASIKLFFNSAKWFSVLCLLLWIYNGGISYLEWQIFKWRLPPAVEETLLLFSIACIYIFPSVFFKYLQAYVTYKQFMIKLPPVNWQAIIIFSLSFPMLWLFSDIIQAYPRHEWLIIASMAFLLWCGFRGVMSLMVLLFSRRAMTPLPVEQLQNTALAEELIKNKVRLFSQVVANQAVAHAENYGFWKDIILSQALVSLLSKEQLQSIVAHELGHIKNRHNFKYALLQGSLILITVFVFYELLKHFSIYRWHIQFTGFISPSLILLVMLLPLALFWLNPLLLALRRHFEFIADHYSTFYCDGKHLAKALHNIHQYNLTDIAGYRGYILWHQAYPMVDIRVKRLLAMSAKH